jgi:hypothetical protein
LPQSTLFTNGPIAVTGLLTDTQNTLTVS